MTEGHHLRASWSHSGLRRCDECRGLVWPGQAIAVGFEGEYAHRECYHERQREVWADDPDVEYWTHFYCHLREFGS